MKGTRAAIRYAKAVLAQAQEQQALEAVNSDMNDIYHTLLGSEELQYTLQSPVVKLSDKKAVLDQVFTGKHAITMSLFGVLVENNRIDLLEAIAFKYGELYNALQGEAQAVVTTAVPLSGALEEKVLQKVKELTKGNVSIENKVDPSIIGGFILRIGDLQYNASIASQLTNLKRDLVNNSFVA